MHRQYSRNFVTLKQECEDYTVHGRQALGTCILELRESSGKINATIQHLKPENIYKLCLISANEQTALCVRISTFKMWENHKGEVRCDFNANDVCGTNLPIEAFNVVAVICIKPESDTTIALSGYINQTVTWKNNLVFFEKADGVDAEKALYIRDKHKQTEPSPIEESVFDLLDKTAEGFVEEKIKSSIAKAENPVSNINKYIDHAIKPQYTYTSPHFDAPPQIDISEDKKKDAQSDNADDADQYATEKDFFDMFYSENSDADNIDAALKNKEKEPQKAMDYHETFKAMAKRFNEELEELNAYSILSEEELDKLEVSKNTYPESDLQPDNIESTEIEYNEINRIFRENPKTSPFENQAQDINWVTITLDELSVLPFDLIKYMTHPFLLSGYYKYKHFILGKVNSSEKNKYVLGVPDVYDYSYKAIASELEFRQFKPCGHEMLNDGAYGYWLMTMN